MRTSGAVVAVISAAGSLNSQQINTSNGRMVFGSGPCLNEILDSMHHEAADRRESGNRL